MKRYIYIAPYAGDPTEGFEFTPVAPFDKVELVQPSVGALYPDPGNAVLVEVECQEHTNLTEAREAAVAADPAFVDLGLNLAIATLESRMNDAVTKMSAEYTFVGEREYA